MDYFLNRRTFLLTLAALPVATASAAGKRRFSRAESRFADLEMSLQGRLGVWALDTADGAELGYGAGQRFPLCSTFKVLLAAAILEQSAQNPQLLQRRIRYQQSDLVTYSPITEKHLETGLTVAELCAAALQFSDNTAANLLLKMTDGPAGLTRYARSIGDAQFRLDRWETELNTSFPGDLRDTSTPEAMGRDLQNLVLGSALKAPQRRQLREWMLGNTTGAARIQAGVPSTWKVGDKTGTGDYGTANDIAVVWPPRRAPIVIAVYSTQRHPAAKARSDVLAAATRIVVEGMN